MPSNSSFSTTANQKVVHIHRDMPEKDESGFFILKKAHLYRAYKDLDYTGLYLYLYMIGNIDGYTFALSPQAILNTTGMPTSTCSDQIKKMIKLGYLVPIKEGSNHYHFYEVPYGKEDNEKKKTVDGMVNDCRTIARMSLLLFRRTAKKSAVV